MLSNDQLIGRMYMYMSGTQISRYHLKRTSRPQNVGEHSARVAMLVSLVSPACSANVLKAALLHDISELATGDVPSPAKWANPALAQELRRVSGDFEALHGLRIDLTDDEARLLKWADLADGCLFCIEELRFGNSTMAGTFGRYSQALVKAPKSADFETEQRQIALTMELFETGTRLCNNL